MGAGGRSVLAACVAAIAFVAAACAPPSPGGPGPGTPGGCPMFPSDSFWHADVSDLPVHPRSSQWVASIGAGAEFHADFGSGTWAGGPIGIPFTTVGAGQPGVQVDFSYGAESDPAPYPLPWDSPVEGGQQATGDRHVIVVDNSTCTLHELFDAHRGAGPAAAWNAGSGARWDLRSNALRPSGWTSADAAGLAILPGLVTYEEVVSGDIDHPIRFTAPRTQKAYLWPARHHASSSTDPTRPPMGAWFRLKASVDIGGFSPHARVIAQAMKDHGIILADNGSSWFISGVPDPRWDNDVLHELDALTGAHMEAVDASGLMVHPDSGQVL